MDRIHHSINDENKGSVVGDSASDRNDERRAAIAQMMAENREALGMKVVAIMVQRYGVLPKEMWDLNRISDMGAGRGIIYDEKVSRAMFESITSNSRYSIVHLTISKDKDVRNEIVLPNTLRQLRILAKEYSYHLDLPETLQELFFDRNCNYNKLLVLPSGLRKLKLNSRYNQPLTFPPALFELELGSTYDRPLILPRHLKRLLFAWLSRFNLPLALPAGLLCVHLGRSFNQPTVLPTGIQDIKIGPAFAYDLLLPDSLRKIEWWCNRPIQIPEGVREVLFCEPFDQHVILPSTLKRFTFEGQRYSHPLKFPPGLEELDWCDDDGDGLVLPEGLQKLDWWCDRPVALPLGLKELNVYDNAPLVLPGGLVKVKFNCSGEDSHYNLPESVQEVIWIVQSPEITFSHPSTLQHLIVEGAYDNSEVDLSHIIVQRLTIGGRAVRVKNWPQGLKELAFTVDEINHPLRVPEGCRIVGPTEVTTE